MQNVIHMHTHPPSGTHPYTKHTNAHTHTHSQTHTPTGTYPCPSTSATQLQFGFTFSISTAIAGVFLVINILTIAISFCVCLKMKKKLNHSLRSTASRNSSGLQESEGEVERRYEAEVMNHIEVIPNTAYGIDRRGLEIQGSENYSYPTRRDNQVM